MRISTKGSEKVLGYVEAIEADESQTQLTSSLWLKIISHVVDGPTSLKHGVALPYVSHQFRRLSGVARTKSTVALRRKLREDALDVAPRHAKMLAPGEAKRANIAISKDSLEQQVKKAVVLLTDETKKRAFADLQVRELTKRMEAVNDPERVVKMEETIKQQRGANDLIQGQLGFHMEKIGTLEKQLKAYRTEKLEMETQYEERVFFMEKKGKEKREKLQKTLEPKLEEVGKAKTALEKANDKLRDECAELQGLVRFYRGGSSEPGLERELPGKSTGPTVPDRPSGGRPSTAPEDGTSKPARVAPSPAGRGSPSTSRGGVVVAAATRRESLSELRPGAVKPVGFAPSVPAFLKVKIVDGEGSKASLKYDTWEGNTKVIVAIDLPGCGLDMMDIYVNRFYITVSRRLGAFEKLYFSHRYKPIQLSRLDRDNLDMTVKQELALPCAVRPESKTAYHHHGTLYVTVEKLENPVFSLRREEFVTVPAF